MSDHLAHGTSASPHTAPGTPRAVATALENYDQALSEYRRALEADPARKQAEVLNLTLAATQRLETAKHVLYAALDEARQGHGAHPDTFRPSMLGALVR